MRGNPAPPRSMMGNKVGEFVFECSLHFLGAKLPKGIQSDETFAGAGHSRVLRPAVPLHPRRPASVVSRGLKPGRPRERKVLFSASHGRAHPETQTRWTWSAWQRSRAASSRGKLQAGENFFHRDGQFDLFEWFVCQAKTHAPRAIAGSTPIARRTCDGSMEPTMHAAPLDAQMPARSRLISSVSPSTPGKPTFNVFASLAETLPLSIAPGKSARIPSQSRSRNPACRACSTFRSRVTNWPPRPSGNRRHILRSGLR